MELSDHSSRLTTAITPKRPEASNNFVRMSCLHLSGEPPGFSHSIAEWSRRRRPPPASRTGGSAKATRRLPVTCRSPKRHLPLWSGQRLSYNTLIERPAIVGAACPPQEESEPVLSLPKDPPSVARAFHNDYLMESETAVARYGTRHKLDSRGRFCQTNFQPPSSKPPAQASRPPWRCMRRATSTARWLRRATQ